MATLFKKRSEALDKLEEWQELITHFEISGHTFAYFPVLVQDHSWAEVCQAKLADYLSSQGKKLHILSFVDVEEFKLLTNKIFDETFEPNTEAVWITTPIPFETEQLEIWKQAWRESMARLNQFRNKLTKNYPYTFLFVGGDWIHEITFNIAPDLWSIHSGIIRIIPQLIKTDDDNVRTLGISQQENIVDSTIDADFALRQAERLRGKKDSEAKFAELLLNASKVLIDKGEFIKALEVVGETITVYKKLIKKDNQIEFRDGLASSYMNKGVVLGSLQKNKEEIKEYNKSIKIYLELINVENRLIYREPLAKTYMNKGVALSDLQKFEDSIAEHNKSISVYEELVNKENNLRFRNELAKSYMNKGVSLSHIHRNKESITEYNKAIIIRETLVNKEKRPEFNKDLALVYMNKGVSLNDLQRIEEAVVEYEKAIRIFEELVNKENHLENKPYLAKSYMNKGVALSNLNQKDIALVEFNKSIEIYEVLVNQESMYWFQNDLDLALNNKRLLLEKDN